MRAPTATTATPVRIPPTETSTARPARSRTGVRWTPSPEAAPCSAWATPDAAATHIVVNTMPVPSPKATIPAGSPAYDESSVIPVANTAAPNAATANPTITDARPAAPRGAHPRDGPP